MASYMPLTTDSAVTSVFAAAAARTACRPGRREGKVEGRRGEHLTRGVPTPAGRGRDDGVTDGDFAARRAAVARVDRAATAGRAHAPTANETDILAACVRRSGTCPRDVDVIDIYIRGESDSQSLRPRMVCDACVRWHRESVGDLGTDPHTFKP
jgi:hypothetical protein